MKTAIVYDRVNKWGGAEQILLTLNEIFPNAPLFTSVFHSAKVPWAAVFPEIYTTFLDNISVLRDKHEFLAPLMPLAFESFSFDGYDLVISVTSEAAKGIITKPGTKHICYCLTPTRYLWSHHNTYFHNNILRTGSKPVINYLRTWDKIAAQRPDKLIAISTGVQKRIKKYYKRESEIVYPPVDTDKFQNINSKLQTNLKTEFPKLKSENYFLVVSRLVAYKKVDLVIHTFNELKYPLVIVGTGSEENRLRKMAKSNIYFTGFVGDGQLIKLYQNSLALILPQEEDFGMVAVEAQAAGVPVIAYNKGGSVDTVIDLETGVYFSKQNKKSLTTAVKKFEKLKFNKNKLTANAYKFSHERFKNELLNSINSL
jgi:glycosyltransferase involved in cell wall biosynthesis